MKRVALILCSLLFGGSASATELEVPFIQTGGFFADGGVANSPTFQNYFVGYGTTPGFPRTAERRSFFVFDIPAIPTDIAISGAVLKLRLPFGGLVCGKGPGDPSAGPVPSDPSETFALGHLAVPSSVVLSPTLGSAGGLAIFSAMDDSMVASPTVFTAGMDLPPAGDGGPPIVPIMLDGAGIAALEAARGGSIVLTGWMPSWSEDMRPTPSPSPLFFEASELIFGLTDAHALAVLKPSLILTLAPVPEPSMLLMWMAALVLVLVAVRRHAAGSNQRAIARG